jgi:acetyl esterase/lipase
MARYDLEPFGEFAAALSKEGVATWTLEFRRVGNAGGGWPGTFQDVAAGADYVRELAKRYPLDLSRVIVVGHSSGGHLAAWLAARPRLAQDSVLYSEDPIRLHGLVVLAGVPDLREALTGRLRSGDKDCGEATRQIIGGMPDEVPDHFLQGSPIELLPFGVPQHNIVGDRDNPHRLDMIKRYTESARQAGDHVDLTILPGAGHFDVVSTSDTHWPKIRDTILAMAGVH